MLGKQTCKLTLAALGAAALCSPLAAQTTKDVAGMTKGLTTRWITRASAQAGTIATRYKAEWLRIHGEICGAAVTNFDFVTGTQDSFTISVYLESTPTSNIPAATPVFTSPSVVITNGTQRVSFAPITLPTDGRDLFMAINHASPIGTGNDGGWVRMTRADLAASTTVGQADRPGRRLGSGATNTITPAGDRITFTKVGTAAWGASTSARQPWIEPLLDPTKSISGVAVTKQNQAEQPGRGMPADGIIGGLLSGIHPDIDNHNAATTPRADSAGFCVESDFLQDNDIVLYYLSSGFAATPVTLPGVVGAANLDASLLIFIGADVITGGAKTSNVLVPGLPTTLPNTDVYWQGIIIRGTTIAGFSNASIQRL